MAKIKVVVSISKGSEEDVLEAIRAIRYAAQAGDVVVEVSNRARVAVGGYVSPLIGRTHPPMTERIKTCLRNEPTGASLAVMANRMNANDAEVLEAVSKLESDGEVVKTKGRRYRGEHVEKWKLVEDKP